MNETRANQPSHKIEWLVWSALAVTVIAIAAAFVWTRFYSDGLRKPLDVVGEVPPFTLTNQFGQPLSNTNLLGQVWVADVIFSRCPVSCERMTQRMLALQQQLGASLPVKFVSITADPDFDTPDVLKRYAANHKADLSRWHFLSGPKKQVYALTVNGLKFVVLDKTEQRETPDDLFVHSTQFALVDKRGKIRGYFEGTEEEDRRQLLLAVKKLAREK